jgi:hypothetical protein
MLAQAANSAPVEPGFMAQLFSGQCPTQDQFIQSLVDMGSWQGLLLLAAGLVYLFYGWKVFKALVIINAGLVGLLVGYYLGSMGSGSMRWFGSIAGAVLLAALAWPLMKYAISVMGALAGGALGYGAWAAIASSIGREDLMPYAWAGAVMGLITLGLLAFVILQMTVITFTSLQGAVMAVGGLLCLLMKHDPFRQQITDSLLANPALLPLLCIVPAPIGWAIQHATIRKKTKKKPSGE